jgi:hypothetical protein
MAMSARIEVAAIRPKQRLTLIARVLAVTRRDG